MNRKLLHFCSVAVVLFLAVLFLYFYITGRIDPYVAPEFRRWALLAGLGLAVLGLFNLATANQAEACGHDHDHGDDGCCGHDHNHGHAHDHGDGGGEPHHHGESPSGVILALIVLTLPMLVAANSSVDRFSTEYAIRWANITEKLHRLELNRAREREKTVAKAEPKQTPHGGTVAANAAQQSPPESTSTTATVADAPPQPGGNQGESTAVAAADTPPATQPVGAPQAADEGAGAADSPPAAAAEKSDDDGWGEFTLEDLKRMVPQSSEGNFMLEVPQLFYTANDTELQRVLEGLPIETIAQVMPVTSDDADSAAAGDALPATPTPVDNSKRLRLFRMFIECCAADMRPLPVTIQFKDALPEYEEMGWVKVVGKVRYEHVDGVTTPIVDVITMEPTAEPMDMMVY